MREDQIKRYARHVLLSDVGGVGQRRLLRSSAVVDVAAGPGAVALVYLAAAGVGTLVVRDGGQVAEHDVGFLYESGDVGRPRLEAARERLTALNPDVSVVAEGDGRRVELAAGDDPIRDLLDGTAAVRAWMRAVIAGET